MRRDCSLVQLEDMLDRNLFIRISKSGIVNLMNVDSYKKGTKVHPELVSEWSEKNLTLAMNVNNRMYN